MAHIVKFQIEGLAGRAEAYGHELDRHVNVFFGLNGAGKTSLLKIFHSAMAGDATLLKNVPFVRAEVHVYSIDNDKVFVYECEKKEEPSPTIDADQPTEALRRPAETTSALVAKEKPLLHWRTTPKTKKNQTWTHRYLPTARLLWSDKNFISSLSELSLRSRFSEEQLEELFAELVNQLWGSYSATVLGAVQRAQAKGLAKILTDVLAPKVDASEATQLDPAAAYARVSKFLKRQGAAGTLGSLMSFEENYLGDRQLRRIVNDINDIEYQIQEATAPRDKLRSLVEEMFSGNKKTDFTDTSIEITGSQEKKISLARLSSGEKQLLRILIDSLLAGPNSILLDEPEISMHVDWQRRLIGDMRQLSPDSQLIVATHSPEIMAEIDDKNIFRI